MKKVLSLLFCLFLLASMAPGACAAENQTLVDLSALIDNPVRRHFVEGMIDYTVCCDSTVKKTLEDGYIALFFFEGASDNMDDETLSDISYYRVSAVCVAVRQMADGTVGVVYFNENCSTLPDRPLEYGKKKMEDGTITGPATVMDGTYELYSVKHNGVYEALHMQTSQEDETIAAVYMSADGYVNAQASLINIHTRTGNHVIEKAMWSAGCLLVGDGDYGTFAELVASTYYASYETYEKDQFVGTVTVNRQLLKQQLYDLYENRDAVDMLLSVSRRQLPEKYLAQCQDEILFESPQTLMALLDTQVMTLPCSSGTDPRSVAIVTLEEGEQLNLVGSVSNSRGNTWFLTEIDGETGYVYGGYLGAVPEEPPESETPQEPSFWSKVLGWFGG